MAASLVAPLVVVVVIVVRRRIVPLLAALGVSATVAGCGHTGEASQPSAQPPASQPSPAGSGAGPDISRVDSLKDDFPPGFTVQAHPAKTLGEQDIAGSGVAAFTAAQIDPPQCRSAVIPPNVDPTVGTDAAGVRAEGDQGTMYVVALRSPKAIPVSMPAAGCDRVSMSGSPEASGTVTRIPAPRIPDATTTAAKLTVDDPEQPPDYLYTAALDDRTSVVVMGSADDQLDPQRLLSDLLVKAAAAVRGR